MAAHGVHGPPPGNRTGSGYFGNLSGSGLTFLFFVLGFLSSTVSDLEVQVVPNLKPNPLRV